MSISRIAPIVAATALISAGGVLLYTQHLRPEPLVPDKITLVASADGVGELQAGTPSSGATAADDSKTAVVVAQLLSGSHFARHPLDDTLSARLFDKYLETLDSQRMAFFASDVNEFSAEFKTTLDEKVERGDTSPAQIIFARYKQRVEEQSAYVTELLKDPKNFVFTGNDTILTDRKSASRPKDVTEAQAIWKQLLRYEYLQEKLAKTKEDEIAEKLARRYQRSLRDLNEIDSDDVFEMYLGTLAHLYDPHTAYLGRASAEEFAKDLKLSLFGIGARLRTDEDGYTVIEDLTPGSPAEKSGKLHPGDKIVAVAQDGQPPVDVVDMRVTKVVTFIRGPKDTKVQLTIIPANAPDPSKREQVTLIRDEIKLEDQAAKARLIETTGTDGKPFRVGVVQLPNFYMDRDKGRSGAKDVAMLIEKLQKEKVAGIVLDLRNNPGGYLPEAVKLTGLFIPQGPVVQVKDYAERVNILKDTDDGAVTYKGPLAVLINRGSASASEIVAGALQDYGRAVILGDETSFGKGTVQQVIELGPLMQNSNISFTNNPGQVNLTIQKFYRASGASTQLKGVASDIALPSITNALLGGEAKQDNPLPWDTIDTSVYQKDGRVTPLLPELKKRSSTRVAQSADFIYRREEIARLKKIEAQKVLSLNEQIRSKELAANEARTEARQKTLALRPAPTDKVYVITLADATKPGLPKPLTPEQIRTGRLDKDSEREASLPAGKSGEKKTPRAVEPDLVLNEATKVLSDFVSLAKPSTGVLVKK